MHLRLVTVILCVFSCFLCGFAGCGTPDHIDDIEPVEDISPLTFATVIADGQNAEDGDGTVRMIDTVSEHLGKYLRMMSDPAAADVKIYLWARTNRVEDPVIGPAWHATVGTWGVRQNGREYWRFQMKSGDRSGNTFIKPVATKFVGEQQARLQAIEKVAEAVAKRIIKGIRNNRTVGSSGSTQDYTFKFVGFSASQHQQIRTAFLGLQATNRPYLKLNGGQSMGREATYRCKWLHDDNSPEHVLQVVEETIETNGVLVDGALSSPGIAVFMPGS